MSSILIFPIKKYSERVQGKNFVKVNDQPLYQIATMAALRSGAFDNVVIDTDSDEIWNWGKASGFTMLSRLPDLATNHANGNSLLRYHVEKYPGYDYYWQGFVTAPFITEMTISELEWTLRKSFCDSVMTVKALKGHFWTSDRNPLYRPDMLPRSQDLQPLYQEVSGFFGITAEAFNITKCRVGTNPEFYVLPEEETLDIDWPKNVEGLK